MREEEAGTRYLSPLVKQDLANLDSDGESRRLALRSLKQFIEQLDATSMPKFLAQISESREPCGSRSYAISLYEEVARVHRKLIKPHLPRVMSSLIRALAASGSSPQLRQACAKVTAAMARYTIDPTMCIEDAEDVIQDICDPLAKALAGKMEPVAAGAAACIHALIETENWKYACDETVQEVCQRTSVALSEKPTRTVFHLQLACALASMNPDTLGLYGATILKAGEEILKSAVDSWQLRKAAAKLLQGVLTILDKEKLECEVDLAIHALESCRLDKMPHVRAAVSEALYAAKMLASGDSIESCRLLSGPLSKSICKSVEQSHSSWTKRDIEQSPSPWIKSDVSSSPVLQKRIVSPTSQESNQLSFSPASTSTMESLHIRHISTTDGRSNSQRSKRTPLYPVSGMGFTRSSGCNSPGTFSPSGSSTDIECEFTPQKLNAKENTPARMMKINRALPVEEFGQVQVQAKSILLTPTPSQQLDHKFGVDIHTAESKDEYFEENHVDRSSPHAGKEASRVPISTISRHIMSPMVSAILDELTETASNILAEDDAGLAQLDSQIEEACNLKSDFKNVVLPRLRLGNVSSSDSLSKSSYAAGASNSKQNFSCTTSQSNEMSPSSLDVRNASGCVNRCVEVETRDVNLVATDTTGDFAPIFEGSDNNPLRGSDSHEQVAHLKHHYNALAHLDFSPEKAKPLITSMDFLPFATPKRLMHALQFLNSSNPDSQWISLNQDIASCQDDGTVDMDVETSSEAGWSVIDNPIASDESFHAGSSDEELEDRLKLPPDDSLLQNILSTNCISPRDIHMLPPVCHESLPVHGEEAKLPQEDTYDFTLECVPSNITTPISTQAHDCIRCDNTYSIFSADIHRSISSELRTRVQIVEGSDSGAVKHICNGPADAQPEDEVEKNELRCNCQDSSDGYSRVECCKLKSSEQNPQRWWDSRSIGRFMLVRLVARDWRNLCWYGEILLGGTLCVVLTLPLAMALAKALTSPQDHLVPT
ncbi:hypothetical protein M758_1G203300 [Ceratodon purpureus]|nr:hypothetical protein M758_1G203300 [Ceratodon purpureus]